MASTILFANNAGSTLAGAINNVATVANLQTGSGALFPNPGTNQYFVGTFTDAATGLLNEIVWVTARASDAITMTRAQEGTTALSWLAGDLFNNRVTAGQMASMQQAALLALQPIPGYHSYLAMSAPGGAANFTVQPCSATDSTNAALMTLAAAMQKTTAIWAAGTGNGGLDTGAIGAGAYWVFLIMNPTTQAVDVLFSASRTSPNLPSGYTLFRVISWVYSSGTTFNKITQLGNYFQWGTAVAYHSGGLDIPTSPTLINLNATNVCVPNGINVIASMRLSIGSNNSNIYLLCSPYETCSVNTPPGNGVIYLPGAGIGAPAYFITEVLTDTSGEIQWAATADSGVNDTYLNVFGFSIPSL